MWTCMNTSQFSEKFFFSTVFYFFPLPQKRGMIKLSLSSLTAVQLTETLNFLCGIDVTIMFKRQNEIMRNKVKFFLAKGNESKLEDSGNGRKKTSFNRQNKIKQRM